MKSWYSSKRKQIVKINLLQDLYSMWSWTIQWKTNGKSEQEGREKAAGYILKDFQENLKWKAEIKQEEEQEASGIKVGWARESVVRERQQGAQIMELFHNPL